ncbi:FkbM family methyltransferase [Brucella intermedia]|uniref:FkbM family methyltransferase n=3 Tax=Brucella intermedia TaxID=94625 RepID=U4VAN9_9HYPH|nr:MULTISPECIES: FkbM family methyltransferase [Brucella/Ochrobactrum group]ERM01724.1 FkbM family methyltransferase [Brucella intermedia 229E]PJT18736.1 FkbM family methyltransferase [Ochrobactrum sp. 30A/1000/2015]PJT39127.1 FkbM family methyltransferase [Ochrobactrum sp. 27A/999/2015]PJT43196.1 FkbM family methyltransferase [Ochrobactrum sp. 23A/997/2015]EEQ92878.1 methyltransferase, FkbM family [Brucella intermedia LMG 3301]
MSELFARLFEQDVPWGTGAQELLKVHGINVPITSDEVSPVIWQALTSGSYEAKEARSIFKAVKPGDRVLELGSGIGIITSIIARIADVSVWAFEANPTTAALARRVVDANGLNNVVLSQGILTAGEPSSFRFYVRRDLWMSSMDENQGPYEHAIELFSTNIDEFIAQHGINVLVMDIEGAERDLLQNADLTGVERIFLELHDHLYGLAGIRDMTQALASKGYAYDPRGSQGPCVLFSKDDGAREYEPD